MFVLNPCTNDARVIKEANTLGKAGYKVKVIAVFKGDNDLTEEREHFTIFRVSLIGLFSYIKLKTNMFCSSYITNMQYMRINMRIRMFY